MMKSSLININQPILATNQLIEVSYIKGVYRLTSCVVRFDKKKQPYWKLQFVDSFGTVTMYLFEQPTCLESLYHGAFVKLNASKDYFQGQVFFKIKTIEKIEYDQVDNAICINSIPSVYCKKPEVLVRLNNVLCLIQNQALIKFIVDVLTPIDVCLPFLQAPASLNYHHNYSGGLLLHTVEVMEIISNLPFETHVEKELALVGGLLHDIGKIKSLSPKPSRLETGKWVDHDALTLEICAVALINLDKRNSLFSNILRHIWTCRTTGVRYGYKSKLIITDAVQLADRFSAWKVSKRLSY